MKINVKLAALIVAIAILPLALSNIIVYTFIEQAVKDVAHAHLELAAISRRDRLAGEFQHNRDRLALVASHTALRLHCGNYLADPDANSGSIDRIRKIVRDANAALATVDAIIVLDLDGAVIATSNPGRPGNELGTTDFFADSRDRYQVTGLDFSQKRWCLGAPLQNSDGRNIAVVMLIADATDFFRILENPFGLGKTGEALLLAPADDNTHYRYLSGRPAAIHGRNPTVGEVRQLTTATANGRLSYTVDYSDASVVALAYPIPKPGWTLLVKGNTSEMLADIVNLRRSLILIMMATAVIAVVFALGFTRTFTWPIGILTRFARDIREGRLDKRLDLSPTSGFATLGNTFNDMTLALRRRRDDLERKVAERTAALDQSNVTLEKQTQILQSILNNMGDAVIVSNPEDRLILSNPAAESMIGAVRKHTASAIHGRFLDEKRQPIAVDDLPITRALKGESVDERELVLHSPDSGDDRFVSINARPMLDADDNVQGSVMVMRDISRRKLVESKLAETNQMLESIINSMSEGLVVADADGNLILFNAAAERILGMGPTDAATHEWPEIYGVFKTDTVTPWPSSELSILRASRGESLDNLEMFIRNSLTTDGAFINVSGRPLRDSNGELRGGLVVFRDVTEAKQAQEELRDNNNLLFSIVESTEDTIFVKNNSGRYVLMNSAGARVYGRPRAEIEGRHDEVLFPREIARQLMENDRAILADGNTRTTEESIVTDGQTQHFLSTKGILRDKDGNAAGIVGISHNITQRIEAEAALHVLRLALENTLEGIAHVNRYGCLDTVNPAYVEIHGFKRPDEMTGREWQHFISPAQGAQATTVYQQMMDDGKAEFEALVTRPDDTTFHAQITLVKTQSKNGEFDGSYCFVKDISERKNTEDARLRDREWEARTSQLEADNIKLQAEVDERLRVEAALRSTVRQKDTLLREIHHRVKNNLQVISSMLSLQSANIEEESVLQLFRESRNRVRALALLHERLMSAEDLEKIDINDYIHNLVANVFRSYGMSTEHVSTEVDVDDIRFDVDTAIPCGLIINELVSNSLKHAFNDGHGGCVNVSLHRDAHGGYELAVHDNGKGLPENFDFRTTESVGLQLVVALTQQLNGEISLGNGTTGTKFQIDFRPRAEKDCEIST
jgi:PAS domain S-box-containing protein